jgi:hypothetical protein
MRLELMKGLQLFFSKKIEANYVHPLLSLLLYFECSKNIYGPQVCGTNDTKIIQFG